MKRVSLVGVALIFAAMFSVSAMAQATPAGKIGLVNVNVFADDKEGITRFRNALNSLDPEFKPLNDELKTMQTRYQTLVNEISAAQKPAPSGVPAKADAVEAKVEEARSLEINIKRKQEDGKRKYETRYGQVVGPIFADIVKGMNEFAKAKGYAVILDGAKLEEAGLLMGFDEKYDVTKEFITFYNARPAGAASSAAPKK